MLKIFIGRELLKSENFSILENFFRKLPTTKNFWTIGRKFFKIKTNEGAIPKKFGFFLLKIIGLFTHKGVSQKYLEFTFLKIFEIISRNLWNLQKNSFFV